MTPVVALIASASAFSTAPPPSEKAATARWIVSSVTWGTLTTLSTRTNGSHPGDPFGNPYSFADAQNGVPYFYVSDLDASMVDIFHGDGSRARASLALSEASLAAEDGTATVPGCQIGSGAGDPENPPCARLVLSGTMVKLTPGSAEETTARSSLFARHPSFKQYPKDHNFYLTKLDVDGIWLIDAYGGAAIVPPREYFNSSVATHAVRIAPVAEPLEAVARAPPFWKKVATARWMARTLTWGVLSTISSRTEGTIVGDPFGNPYSFSDVDGQPYFYASDMDASMIDLFQATKHNSRSTFTLSEASLTGSAVRKQSCQIGTSLGDPENPPCARLVLSGSMLKVAAGSAEEKTAKAALIARHPSFSHLPSSHHFYVAKLQVDGIWLIDMFGGAAIISPEDYFAAA